MPLATVSSKTYRVPFRSFIPFLLISFGLAWGILGLYIFLPDRMVSVFGHITGNHPLFFLAVYAPAIAAFILVVNNGAFTQQHLLFKPQCLICLLTLSVVRRPYQLQSVRKRGDTLKHILANNVPDPGGLFEDRAVG
jgi:hypothetical protein